MAFISRSRNPTACSNNRLVAIVRLDFRQVYLHVETGVSVRERKETTVQGDNRGH